MNRVVLVFRPQFSPVQLLEWFLCKQFLFCLVGDDSIGWTSLSSMNFKPLAIMMLVNLIFVEIMATKFGNLLNTKFNLIVQ